MKTRILGILLVISMLGGASISHAAPEQIHVKDSGKKAKERAAATKIKNINVQDIEDPAAQNAIQEILNYLGLKYQK